jgi:tRNA pseudouridine32 synthase/23S rRNA pseudouridine746 synthase
MPDSLLAVSAKSENKLFPITSRLLISSPTAYAPPPDSGIDFVYRDEFLLVVNKPPGLLSVPGRGDEKSDSLTTRVKKEFPDALSVHRLDMSTSGLMVLALGKEMHGHLSRLFRERKVSKRYVALVAGRLDPAVGVVDLPLGSDWPNRPRQQVDFARGKSSLTHYRLLAYDADTNTSRVELEPVTGRTHQLRVHMTVIGHPIVGDALYGGAADATAEGLLLHASVLSITHPFSTESLTLASEAPF